MLGTKSVSSEPFKRCLTTNNYLLFAKKNNINGSLDKLTIFLSCHTLRHQLKDLILLWSTKNAIKNLL
jgi:hypothetical protein